MTTREPRLKQYSGTILSRYDKGINTRFLHEGTGVVNVKRYK